MPLPMKQQSSALLPRCSSSELVCAIETPKSGPYEVKCELFNDRIQVLYEVDLLALNIISLILIHISQCCGQLS